MSDKDFEAIYAITFEAPKRIGTMIASTPTGRRGMFYKVCNEMKFNQEVKQYEDDQGGHRFDLSTYDRESSEGWQEFYFPTMVNPEWSPAMEKELRTQYSTIAYEHEVLAEFGTEMVGVFNKEYIDEASKFHYAFQEQRVSMGPIVIGVDWD